MDDQHLPTDEYSQTLRRVLDNPSSIHTRPTTIQAVTFLGQSETWIVQTVRADNRDTVFVQHVAAEGSERLVLPPSVTGAIARQRDALAGVLRRKAARQAAETRKQRGIEPAFLKRAPAENTK